MLWSVKLRSTYVRTSVICDNTPLPAQLPDEEQDEAQLEDYPWVDAPFKMDYGYNVK